MSPQSHLLAARRVAFDASASLAPGWSPNLIKARAYERLLLDVILGVLEPGARLDEHQLARRYDTGLAGVRDALGRLALEGLVIRKARSGTTVAPLDPLEPRQTRDVRLLLEPHAAALAAEHADPEEIESLAAAFEGADQAIQGGDLRSLVLMDQTFHARLAAASGNPALAGLIAPLQHRAARFWIASLPPGGELRGRLTADLETHRAIVLAISLRDASAARSATTRALGVARPGQDRLGSRPSAAPLHAA